MLAGHGEAGLLIFTDLLVVVVGRAVFIRKINRNALRQTFVVRVVLFEN